MVQSREGINRDKPAMEQKRMTNIEVTAYYRSNGTFVKGYFRKGFRRADDLSPDDKFMKDYYPKQE